MEQNAMIFRLSHEGGEETEFVVCHNTEDSPWFDIGWNLGDSLKGSIEEPIIYYADKNITLEDFPWGNSIQFIASPKLLKILTKSGADFEVFRSVIRFPDGREVKDYVTINFTECWPVVHRGRSKFMPDPDFPETMIYEIEKLVVDHNAIPKSEIFIMAENLSWILVKRKLKEEIERQGITGIELSPVEVV